ncbi:amidohydrolase [Lentzea sp. NBRC 102530]|uniref:amidohydrolase n=1 Tax=Lentzea sp. NBRC 102530 TaxID=3032201 RepID=UPI0024A011EB|nr:amidohydrolase [Lentzea sp. NBRC 102530]GLY48992.1 putative amidohydrolase [Lentzea sp. NBRC 102530]
MPDLHALYRDLHAHPELSWQEFRTAGVLADALRPLGYEVATGFAGTGVVGVLRNGEGPTVLLRADIDALPVLEATGLPYASTVRATTPDGADVPVAHACGHDMHATCLIGAAERLAAARAEWSGTLLVVFQPAEELGQGARAMVDAGLFDRFGTPEVVLAQHVSPLPAGMIAHGSGPVMAASDSVRVTLHGRGGHGSAPETAIDPVLMAAHCVVRLQGIVSREVAPSERAVVTVGRLQAGTKENVIPDTAEIGVNIRSFNEHVRGIVKAAVERIVRAEAAASGAPREPEFDWYDGTPVLVSDPDATARTMAAFAEHFGSDNLIPGAVVNASEDVGVFGASAGVPTVFWFLGGTDFGRREPGQPVAMNHAPDYAPDLEPTLTTGVDALVVAARTWLA